MLFRSEMELFVQMFYRVSEYSEGFCDVLGDMFMECVSHGNNGQFFTPIPELLTHEQQLLAGVSHHVAKEGAQVCKLGLIVTWHQGYQFFVL